MAVFICDLKTFENWPASMQDAVLAAGAEVPWDSARWQKPKKRPFSASKRLQIHAMTDHEKKAFNDILKPLADPYREKIGPETLKLLEDAT